MGKSFSFPNPFAFYGQENEAEKLYALIECFQAKRKGVSMKCATDKFGNPQAYFIPPVLTNKSVLGAPSNEGLELEHTPTLLLAAPSK